ncbi:MAG TPA: DnaA/Hda family protein [Vitreimonas sp.]|jgi:chromosomal replication initiator protein|nr:DnaA/Hda family protein [Vitreimonas sp.]
MELGEEARRRSAGVGAARAYELVRKELFSEFGADFYRSYVDPLRLVADLDGVLLFRASTQVAQERLRQQAQHRLEKRLQAYEPRIEGIEILLEHEIPDDVRALADARIEEARPALVAGEAQPQSMTFDTFCQGPSNHRAFTVARMIAAGEGDAFPVWLVHSAPGLGKTHLLSSIAHEAGRRMPERKVLMMTGQEYLEQFQSALHKKRDSSSFKEMVRAPHLLLIDDFHRICGKPATELEAFDTIHELTRRGGQVVLAADHDASGLKDLNDALRARLKGVPSCEIDEPDAALRRRILDMRVQHHARLTPGFSVGSDALDMIAERITGSGRDLDGALSQLIIEWKISGGTEVTMEAAANALQAKLSEAAEKRITVQLVQRVVARHYNMSVQQLLERTRRHTIARPRQTAMFLACRMTQASLPDIGARFGGFDHTTVMYARDRVQALVEQDAAFKAEIEGIMRAIKREP